MRSFRLLFLLVALALSASAASPHREVLTFSYNGNVGFGNSVFVVGNHPDLGAWDPSQAVKLRPAAENVWTGQIAIQSGTQLQYKFIRRSTFPGEWCIDGNAVELTGLLTRKVPAQPPAPFSGKAVYYFSSWSAPNLFYRSGGDWVTAPMQRAGPGRAAGESLWQLRGIGEAGEPLEFVFNNGAGSWDNPLGGGNYLTTLDVLHVQDGNVYSYQPEPQISAPQIVSQFINSTAPNIDGRNIRIYLPRGYVQNSAKRYPVLYLHDGQNVFDPGGSNGSWSADATATREMARGRMREAILVAIDNTPARIAEYQPPTDKFSGTPGRADAYASFVINNVRPYVDTHFRTLNDPENTLTLGSSMGGLVSLYLGREFTTFGKIGVISPAFWTSTNYVAHVNSTPKRQIRVYLDYGTAEDDSPDDWDRALSMYDTHLAQGYAANGDVTFVSGCGHGHDEAAWKERLPGILHYLLPEGEEPALLTMREHPPTVVETAVNRPANRASFIYTGQFGLLYTLERSADFVSWSTISTTPRETLPWSRRTIEDADVPPGSKMFWRVRAIAP